MRQTKPLKSKKPLGRTPLAAKPLAKKKLETNASLQAVNGFNSKDALKKRTLKLLEKTEKEAKDSGLKFSEWEDGFLTSVRERVSTYGRAFHDPEKGAQGATLSLRQGLKVKEIRQKIKKTKLKAEQNQDIDDDNT